MAVAAGARAPGQKQSEPGQPGRADASPASLGPQHPVLRLQQGLGNQAVLRLLGSGGREASGSGRPLPSAVRGLMEQRFAADFGGVRVHTDSRSAMLSRALQAKAFTRGSDIFFSAGRYSPDSPGGERLLAHELAHVVQQRGKTGGTARLGDPGSSAERRAERAAEAVIVRAPVPHPGVAPAGEVQRSLDPVTTNGGVWTPTRYAAFNAWTEMGKGIGAVFTLGFMPIEPVEADTIGLLQTVTTLKSTAPGGPINTPSSLSPLNASIMQTAAEGDPGRSIDRVERTDDGHTPNTNPIYGVDSPVSHTLTDVAPSRNASTGHRTRRPPGVPGGPPTWDRKEAILRDEPVRAVEFPGQQWRQSFEVTALVLDGPMVNTYLGSVAWGWSADATGTATLDPDPIRIVRAGAPSAQFMASAKKWNDATFSDSSGATYPTVDLPLTTVDSGSTSVQARTTSDLITRQATVDGEVKALPAGVDRTNKEFEKRAVETELRGRKAKVSVRVVATEDWTGADEAYVRMSGSGGSFQTPVHQLNDGQSFDFLVPLAPFLPLTGPVTVDVYDKDALVGDDLVGNISWQSPYRPARSGGWEQALDRTVDHVDYRVAVQFER